MLFCDSFGHTFPASNISHLVSVCGPHALGHLQPAFVDVGDDHVLGPHGAGGQQVDQPDGTGAADQDLLAERHARPPGHVTRGSMLTSGVYLTRHLQAWTPTARGSMRAPSSSVMLSGSL